MRGLGGLDPAVYPVATSASVTLMPVGPVIG